ncbi:MAG: Lrp/AsnC ligand binding domain-containing protein [Candidatus Nezhaarchaeota archaeon]|nr:Lrp/AsnC ligand binding domain-containing protein [Candidatus Nezhaarchaeota archaeon]MCX8141197.1 Lrp/AsnC ligand binding domain-containing protein [Candidatus Nezhaarchaeota archaeon]MDW8049463.1 Lrp/AsnC ligand binding domain-containing protein [Nitrososphaerota archaeon]
MVNAVVLIKSVATKQDELISKLKVMEQVRKVYPCYGRFDLVVFIDVPDVNAVKLLSLKINSLDGVRSTETLLEA